MSENPSKNEDEAKKLRKKISIAMAIIGTSIIVCTWLIDRYMSKKESAPKNNPSQTEGVETDTKEKRGSAVEPQESIKAPSPVRTPTRVNELTADSSRTAMERMARIYRVRCMGDFRAQRAPVRKIC